MAIPSGQEAIGEVLNPRERPSPRGYTREVRSVASQWMPACAAMTGFPRSRESGIQERRVDHARAQSTYYAADAPWGAGSTVTMKPLRLFLRLLFIATGLAKLLDNHGFAEVIASYQLGLSGLLLLPLGRCSG